eukprot:298775-Prymnesium_polylepis.1
MILQLVTLKEAPYSAPAAPPPDTGFGIVVLQRRKVLDETESEASFAATRPPPMYRHSQSWTSNKNPTPDAVLSTAMPPPDQEAVQPAMVEPKTCSAAPSVAKMPPPFSEAVHLETVQPTTRSTLPVPYTSSPPPYVALQSVIVHETNSAMAPSLTDIAPPPTTVVAEADCRRREGVTALPPIISSPSIISFDPAPTLNRLDEPPLERDAPPPWIVKLCPVGTCT